MSTLIDFNTPAATSCSKRVAALLTLALSALALAVTACSSDYVSPSNTPSPPTKVVGVILFPESDTLFQCDSFQFSAKISATGGIDHTIVWSTSNPNVVTVSATNTATGVGVGTATLTARAKADTTKFDTAFVAVFTPYPGTALGVTSITSAGGKSTDTTNVSGSITVNIAYSLALVSHCALPSSPASIQLAFDAGGKDTTVASQSIDLSGRQTAMTVNTAARAANGSYALPNGSYTLIARIVLQDGTLLTFTTHTIQLNNP